MEDRPKYLDKTADIVTAFVSKNVLPSSELPQLILAVHTSFVRLNQPEVDTAAEVITPAISVKKSITHDHIVCLEDGRKFKSLKRHLRTKYGMTPEVYRKKWNLPKDYPMVAPSYSESRSTLAKQMGLGSGRREKAPTRRPRKAALPA